MSGFSIYPRKRKNGKPVYYVRFKNPDGTYGIAKSTGCSTQRDAKAWAEDYLLRFGTPMPGKEITFGRYAEGFFSWSGKWALNHRIEGRRLSEAHCLARADIMRLHVLPVFAPLSLAGIDKTFIKDFRNNLFQQGYSGSLINKCLCAVRAVLEQAEDEGLIRAVPKIPHAVDKPKTKGILTLEEVRALFAEPWETIDAHCHPARPDIMGYTGNLLAASTGLRLGELLSLQLQDIHLDGGYIRVWRSWDSHYNRMNETTKTGTERTVFLPQNVAQAVRELIALNPYGSPSSFLFYCTLPDKAAEKKVFIQPLLRALARIGITENIRRQRNITFHSWRHFVNSLLLNAKIPLQKVQSITGHLTAEMSQHYYHVDDMRDVLEATEAALFPDQGERTGADGKTPQEGLN